MLRSLFVVFSIYGKDAVMVLYELGLIIPGIWLVYSQFSNGLNVKESLLVLLIWVIIGVLIPTPKKIRSAIIP